MRQRARVRRVARRAGASNNASRDPPAPPTSRNPFRFNVTPRFLKLTSHKQCYALLSTNINLIIIFSTCKLNLCYYICYYFTKVFMLRFRNTMSLSYISRVTTVQTLS